MAFIILCSRFLSISSFFFLSEGVVIQIAVRSDIFFNPEENERTREKLDYLGIRNHLFIVDSDDGHDAFLIEHKQITNFLNDFLAFKSYEDLKVRGQVSR